MELNLRCSDATFPDDNCWLLGQNQVPYVEFTSGKSACAFLKHGRVASGEKTGTILDVKVLKFIPEVVGIRRRHGCGRAFSFFDCLQLLSSIRRIASNWRGRHEEDSGK